MSLVVVLFERILVFLEFTFWIRKGLSSSVMSFLAFVTLSFLNRGVRCLEASVVKAVV